MPKVQDKGAGQGGDGEMSGYSRPAIEFQAALKAGDRFTPIKDYAAYAGRVLIIRQVRRAASNPDDWLYDVEVEGGTDEGSFVRSWWLRQCCMKFDQQAQ